jgi:hypothetical protein
LGNLLSLWSLRLWRYWRQGRHCFKVYSNGGTVDFHFLPAFFLRALPLAIPAALARSFRWAGVSFFAEALPALLVIFLSADRSALVSFSIAESMEQAC